MPLVRIEGISRSARPRGDNPFTSGKLAALGQALSPVPGTRMLDLACGSGGMMLVGEPYWRQEPPDQATVEGCHAAAQVQRSLLM